MNARTTLFAMNSLEQENVSTERTASTATSLPMWRSTRLTNPRNHMPSAKEKARAEEGVGSLAAITAAEMSPEDERAVAKVGGKEAGVAVVPALDLHPVGDLTHVAPTLSRKETLRRLRVISGAKAIATEEKTVSSPTRSSTRPGAILQSSELRKRRSLRTAALRTTVMAHDQSPAPEVRKAARGRSMTRLTQSQMDGLTSNLEESIL